MACYAQSIIKLERPIWDSVRSRQIWQIPVDCGKCYECIQKRKLQWSFRLEEEARISKTARFVTLTLDTEHLEFTKRGNKTLVKNWQKLEAYKGTNRKGGHIQDFMKRLRYYHETEETTWHEIEQIKKGRPLGKRNPIKYYAIGEYGGLKGRPHYHLILFNALDDHIKKAWTLGQIWIDEVNINSILYVLSYMEKEEPADKKRTFDPEIQRKFSLQSKHIGENYIHKNAKWHNEDNDRNYVTLGNIKVPIPRSMRKKIYDERKRRELVGHIKAKVDEAKEKEDKKHIRNKLNPVLMQHSKIMAKEHKKNNQQKMRKF